MRLMDRVTTPQGRRALVMCLQPHRALVWYGRGQGEEWHALGDLRPRAPEQLDLPGTEP